jgi:hypothetical protein
MSNFVSRKAAAKILQDEFGFGSVRLLAELAVNGDGPRYAKVGREALYPVSELREWASSRLSVLYSSASEHEKARRK